MKYYLVKHADFGFMNHSNWKLFFLHSLCIYFDIPLSYLVTESLDSQLTEALIGDDTTDEESDVEEMEGTNTTTATASTQSSTKSKRAPSSPSSSIDSTNNNTNATTSTTVSTPAFKEIKFIHRQLNHDKHLADMAGIIKKSRLEHLQLIIRNSKHLKTDTKWFMEHFCWKNVILQKSYLINSIWSKDIALKIRQMEGEYRQYMKYLEDGDLLLCISGSEISPVYFKGFSLFCVNQVPKIILELCCSCNKKEKQQNVHLKNVGTVMDM